MKRLLSVLLIVMMAVVFTAPAVFADAGDKLKGGFEKVVMSPKNIPDSIEEEYESATFKPFGVIGGGIKGLFYTGWDFATGLVDILTFPVDFNE